MINKFHPHLLTQGPDVPGEGVFASCSAKLSDTEFVILGGAKDGRQARVFNEETGEWREWPRLTKEVYGQACVTLGDIVLMAGGYSNGPTARTVIFDIATGSAREVASLKYPRAYADITLNIGRRHFALVTVPEVAVTGC